MAYRYLLVHPVRYLRALSRKWQRRIIFGVGGLMVGLSGMALAVISDKAQDVFRAFLEISPTAGFSSRLSVSGWWSG
jgi:cytochrome bd-type quinol oxidase subunit 1